MSIGLGSLMAGASLGLLASLHCAAMCGALVLWVVPEMGRVGLIAYQIGRALSYAALGALAGSMGQVALAFVSTQRTYLLWLGIAAFGAIFAVIFAGRRHVRAVLIRVRTVHQGVRGIVLGLMTPFLPCAVLQPVLLLAAATTSLWYGAGLMVAFVGGGAAVQSFTLVFGSKFLGCWPRRWKLGLPVLSAALVIGALIWRFQMLADGGLQCL